MIRRGLCVLAMLSNCVLSSPLTPRQQQDEDVKVMKCVVEALEDVLSRPRPLPVSRDCLLRLRSDDRLVSILRHRGFLEELQAVALQGEPLPAGLTPSLGEQGADQKGGEAAPTPEAVGDVPDRSMLEALGSPGERSILSERTRAGNGHAGEDPGSHRSLHSEEESSKEKDQKRTTGKEHEEEPDEDLTKDNKGGESGGKRSAHRGKGEENERRAAQAPHRRRQKQEDERHQRVIKRGESAAAKGEAPHHSKEVSEEEEEEAPHHSKEVSEEEEKHTQASPEQKELQMVARGRHEEKRGSEEEEGSASRKSEDHEIESLAAIESELESAAQKLHQLQRG